MKLTLVLEVEEPADEGALVYPRVAGSLIDYAAAVVRNNQFAMRMGLIMAKDVDLAGDPPVGFGAGGKITTAHGVTVTEHSIDHELRKTLAGNAP